MSAPNVAAVLGGARFWQRKASSWSDVAAAGGVVDPAVLAIVAGLPVFPAAATPCSYFGAARPQFFVAVAAVGRFLVNTEGLEYARYAVVLPPAPALDLEEARLPRPCPVCGVPVGAARLDPVAFFPFCSGACARAGGAR